MRRAWPSRVAVAAGAACLGVAGVQVATARYPPASFGVMSAAAAVPRHTAPFALSSVGAGGPSRPASTAPRADPLAGVPLLTDPVRLAIPAVHVLAHVTPVTSRDSGLVVPEDPASVGWWTSSARPGASAGSVVLDGHVDSASQGPGALYRLTELRAGDQIVLSSRTQRVEYRVIGRRVYAKALPLPRALFEATDTPRLILLSCGGPFDPRTHSYADNIAVFAVPA